ncbi:MAG: dehydrogenase, partial [Pseudomonadota bacterium]
RDWSSTCASDPEALIENGTLGRDSLVVSMSSGGMYNVPTLPDELDAPAENFNGARAYALHKRAQVTLTDLWKQRHAERGIAFLVAHPGWVDTQGVKTSLPVFRRLLAPVLRGVKEGVDTVLWLIGRRPVTGVERIWFDRAARPVHMGSATREASAPAAQLWDRLASDAGR